MTLSRERRLINGVWRSVTADEGGSGSLPPGGSTGEVLTKASNADGDADWEAGGASSVFEAIRFEIAFDTPNLAVQTFAITSVSLDDNSVTVDGDHTALFPVDAWAYIIGSSSNDTSYQVVSSTLDGGNTVIVLSTPLVDGTADGTLNNTGTAGVAIATLNTGDIWVLDQTRISNPEAWDGTSPHLNITHGPAGVRATYFDLSGLDLAVADQPNPPDTLSQVVFLSDLVGASSLRALESTTLYVYIDDFNNGDPGSTTGTASIMLEVFRV